MKVSTQTKIQLFGVWCGAIYMIAILFGWGMIGGFILPWSPSTDVAQVAHVFQTEYTRIRIGMIFLMIAAMVFIPFAAVLSQLLARVEGSAGVLAYSMLLGAAGNMVLTFYPAIWWLVAAFRPDRSPELIYLMNDMAWLQFIGGVTMYLAMPISMVVAAFSDDSPNPVFPRWSGFANAGLVVFTVPDQLLFFFQSGPFAWNGIFGFYVPVAAFTTFFLLNLWLARAAILREQTR